LKNPIGHLRIRPSTLSRPTPSKPWNIISTDTLQLNQSSNQFKWIVIFVDTFSKYIEAIPVISINGDTISEILKMKIICNHGCPKTIISDNATYYVGGTFPNFERQWEFN
jgi:hypothetical protein